MDMNGLKMESEMITITVIEGAPLACQVSDIIIDNDSTKKFDFH
jgi:hypothetical protein